MIRTALLCLLSISVGDNFLIGQSVTAGIPSSTRHVNYSLSTPQINPTLFYLFDDGHFSIRTSPNHQHHTAANADVTYYSVEEYDDVIPLRQSTNPSTITFSSNTTGLGSSTARQAMSSQNIRVGQSWRAAEDNILYYIIAFRHPRHNSTPMSGQVRFSLDPNLEVQNIINPSTPGQKTYNDWADRGNHTPLPNGKGGEIIWNFDNLMNTTNDIRYLYVEVYVPDELFRETLNSTVTLTNDSYVETQPATSSVFRYPHDPNNIIPNRDCVMAGAFHSQELEYTVNFQNNGEWYVNTIEIEVNCDPQLLTSNVEVIPSACSHTVSSVSVSGNKIYFTLNEVNLPGSNQNVPNTYTYDQTTGYVTFAICTQSNMMYSDIDAEALIYFDGLPPVYTDPASVHVDDICGDTGPCTVPSTANATSRPASSISGVDRNQAIYPNPFNDLLNIPYTVNNPQGSEVTIELLTLSGKQIANVLYLNNQYKGEYTSTFDSSGLAAGVYLVKIITDNIVNTYRVVKM